MSLPPEEIQETLRMSLVIMMNVSDLEESQQDEDWYQALNCSIDVLKFSVNNHLQNQEHKSFFGNSSGTPAPRPSRARKGKGAPFRKKKSQLNFDKAFKAMGGRS